MDYRPASEWLAEAVKAQNDAFKHNKPGEELKALEMIEFISTHSCKGCDILVGIGSDSLTLIAVTHEMGCDESDTPEK